MVEFTPAPSSVSERGTSATETSTFTVAGVGVGATKGMIRRTTRRTLVKKKGPPFSTASLLGKDYSTFSSVDEEAVEGSPTEGETAPAPAEALKEMFTESKLNLLLALLPVACWAHAAGWSDGSIFVITFLAMVPLASMLGVFTEELAAHTNE